VPNADEAAHPITDRQELLEQATVANRECALRRP
jgi:hypothetical protein